MVAKTRRARGRRCPDPCGFAPRSRPETPCGFSCFRVIEARFERNYSELTTELMPILIAAAAAALLVTLAVVALLVRRSSRRTARQMTERVESLNARVEHLTRELAGAREQAELELERSRIVRELGGTIDLDEVLARTLESTGRLAGVDAAVVWLDDVEGKPLVTTIGLSQEEAKRQAITRPPDGSRARAVSIAYRYPEDASSSRELVRAGLAVPLVNGDDELGYLAVFSRSERDFDADALTALELLAERSGPAIQNARRFREARHLADVDALTGLHNRRYFYETLEREVARARRYERDLALVVFDLDDFKAINDGIGHLAADAVLADAAQRVRDGVRSADFACRVGGDEFAVILPESTVADADQLYRRIQQSVALHPLAQGGRLHFSAGFAQLEPNDDAAALFQRADQALYHAKKSGKDRAAAVDTA
jgi:diguanylate cyclase (GGDEF)-like protein